jgi:hypothetical protein
MLGKNAYDWEAVSIRQLDLSLSKAVFGSSEGGPFLRNELMAAVAPAKTNGRPLRIEPVVSRRKKNDFYRVKCDLYRSDPHSVLPLQSLEWLQLDAERHPFYQHARRCVWVVYSGRRPVGRIAAIIDDLYNDHYQERMGFFGFFESPDDVQVAHLLLATAKAWLKAEGCEAMRGPMNPSMKGEFGVLIEGLEHPPFIMMAHSRPYYDKLLQECDMEPIKRFYSFLNVRETDDAAAQLRIGKLAEVCDKLSKRFPDITMRCATPETLPETLREINRIGNVIRSRGWGFVPLTEAELEFNVKQLRRVIDPRTVIGAWQGDRMVGYNVSIPNINWAIKKCWGRHDWIRFPQLLYWSKRIPEVRLIALGVDPEIRARGISAMVTKAMTDLWHEFTRWEFGWIDEANLPSMDALNRAMPLHRYKTYQVYQRSI